VNRELTAEQAKFHLVQLALDVLLTSPCRFLSTCAGRSAIVARRVQGSDVGEVLKIIRVKPE
jgi:putative component of membrane protein insertase Oxa1/YidC/SpoIIIJ protein YidD